MKWKIFKRLFLLLVLLFLYLPIVLLAVYSFTSSTHIGAIRGFSLHNYVTLFTTPELTDMIAGTISLALISALIATVLGTIGAIGAFYSRKNVSAFISTLNQVPVINADVVTGFSICVLLVVALGISKDTYIPLLAGHVTLCAPFVFLSVMPRIQQMDSSIYEAALDLGATPAKALFEILIPQIVPGIISGFSLAVTLYFIAMYTKPATFDTISTYVVNATKGAQTTIKTALWALSTVIFLIVVLIVLISNLRVTMAEAGNKTGNKKKKNRKKKVFRREGGRHAD